MHHPANAAFPRWTLAAALVLVGACAAPLRAQIETPLAGGGGTGLLVYTVPSMDPNRLPLTGPYSVSFWVVNTGTGSVAADFTCSVTGPLTCANVSPISATISPGDSIAVGLTYSTLAGTGAGSVTLTATVDAGTPPTSSGSRNVGVYPAGMGVLTLLTRNQDLLDRGLCLTVGAGEGAGLSCGDLILTHGLPAYRTLGKDRTLTLHYNSATATGLNLVAARVVEPATVAMPSSIRLILTVNGTFKDSTIYLPPATYTCGFVGCTDSYQAVVGRNLNWAGLPTGYYPITLMIRNVYGATLKDSSFTGNVLVVNRSASEYGRGWGLLGVEQLLTPADTTQRVWVAGDGSARVFHRGAGVTSGQLSQSGLTSFSAGNSVDGNTATTAWTTSGSTAATAYVRADLGATFPQAVTSVRVYAATATNATYDVQYSSNGSAWTTVLAGFKPQAGWSSVVWSSIGAYRYWQLKVASNNSAASTIRELSFGAASTFYGAPGDAPDSLVRFTNGGQTWYRRALKHGAKVEFDPAGRHQTTTNRVGAVTSFYWRTSPSVRLDSITVPPNALPRRTYRLFWSGATGLLDSIRDPGGRRLRTVMTSGNLSKVVAPGNLDSTRFAYDARNVMTTRILTRQRNTTRGDTAVSTYTYANNARVTRIAQQGDSAGTAYVKTTVLPWDEYGLAALVLVDTAGTATRIDGPLTGTSDAAEFWVDRFGQPRRSRHMGLNTITRMWHDSTTALPALVTRIEYPHPSLAGQGGRVVRLAWNARGNLVEQRDSTSHLGGIGLPTKVLAYTYGDSQVPDSPTRVQDALGRGTDYVYTHGAVVGLTDSVIDVRGHATKFFVRSTGVLAGLVDSVAERRVAAWIEADGRDSVFDQVVRFTYGSDGLPLTVESPSRAVTSYVNDAFGRTTDIYDPLGTRTQHAYDALNRDTLASIHRDKQVHPGGINPLANVRLAEFDTVDATKPFALPMPSVMSSRWRPTPMGLADSVLDPAGVPRRFRYDALARLREETDDRGNRKTLFWNDTTAQLDSVRMRHGSVIRYAYDPFGRQTRIVAPPRVNPTPLPGGPAPVTVPADTVDYQYDLLGRRTLASNRISTTLVTNQPATIARTYYADGSERSVSSRLPQIQDSLHYFYDAAGALTKTVMRAFEATPWTDSIGYSYTGTGDLATMNVCWGALQSYLGGCRTLTFTWDTLGRRRSVRYPGDSITVTYRYDAIGTLRRVVSGNLHLVQGDRFDFTHAAELVGPTGQVRRQRITCPNPPPALGDEKLAFPCRGGGAVQADTSYYDRRGALVLQRSDAGSYDSLRFDVAGNATYRHRLDPALPVAQREVLDSFFMVTGSNQLLRNSRVQPSQFGLTYYHDAEGARIAQAATPLDANTADDEHYWYYDAFGRQRGYRYVTFNGGPQYHDGSLDCAYDPEGRLYLPCEHGAWAMAMDHGNVIRVGPMWRFAHGPGVDDPLIGRIAYANGTVREVFFVTDGQGRQLSLGEPNGTFANAPWADSFDDYKQYRWAGAATKAFSFAAERQSNANQPEISLFRNRAYDSRSGRWLQEDPIGIAGGINLYQFNGNNPVTYTDPFGLCPKDGVEAVLCNAIEATSTALGAAVGCAIGCTTGALVTAGSGGLALPAGAAVTTVAIGGGATIGLGVGKLVTNVLFADAAGTPAGGAGEQPKSPTAQEIISQSKKGSINRRFPGEMLGKTMEEIERLAKAGDRAARTAKKLLTDSRFDK